MSIGKVFVLSVVLVFAAGGVGAALADWNDPNPKQNPRMDLVDVDARRDDATDVELAPDEDDDDADGAGGAGGAAGANQAPGADGDATAGNDGTAGGNNIQASPAPVTPVVAGGGDTGDGAGAGGPVLGAGGGPAGGGAGGGPASGGAVGGESEDGGTD